MKIAKKVRFLVTSTFAPNSIWCQVLKASESYTIFICVFSLVFTTFDEPELFYKDWGTDVSLKLSFKAACAFPVNRTLIYFLFAEIQFAHKCKKPIVPVRMEQKYRPGENWLGFILGNTVWYDLSNSMTYETQLTNFLGAIANIGTEAKRTDQPGNLWRRFLKYCLSS